MSARSVDVQKCPYRLESHDTESLEFATIDSPTSAWSFGRSPRDCRGSSWRKSKKFAPRKLQVDFTNRRKTAPICNMGFTQTHLIIFDQA